MDVVDELEDDDYDQPPARAAGGVPRNCVHAGVCERARVCVCVCVLSACVVASLTS